MKSVYILTLAVAFLAFTVSGTADSDMNEGLDYDFITAEDDSEMMIPLTPEEKGEVAQAD